MADCNYGGIFDFELLSLVADDCGGVFMSKIASLRIAEDGLGVLVPIRDRLAG